MFPTRAMTILGGDSFRDEYSLAFDGTDDYIQLSDPFNHVNISVSAWIKRTDDGTTHTIFSNQDDATDGLALFVTDDEYVRCKVNSTTSDEVAGTLILANTWNHVVATVTDNSIIKVYVNGVLGDDKSLSGSIAVTTNARIGIQAFDTNNDYEGFISEVAVYDKTLSASEVATLYNGREPYNHKEGVCSSNLQGWWRMGDGSSNNRKHQYIDNSASSLGSNIMVPATFDSGIESWRSYSSGTVSHSTTIASHSGSGGVLKCVTDASSEWLGKTDIISSGMESGKIYIAEGYIYIPSSWSGTRDIYIYSANQFGDSATNIGQNAYNIAQHGTKDEWQYMFYTFLCLENSGSGSIYMRAAGSDNLEADDFIYFDDFTLTEIDKTNSGVMLNMNPVDFVGDAP